MRYITTSTPLAMPSSVPSTLRLVHALAYSESRARLSSTKAHTSATTSPSLLTASRRTLSMIQSLTSSMPSKQGYSGSLRPHALPMSSDTS